MKGGEVSARRYARALLDVATERRDEALREQLGALAHAYAQSAELRAVLLHPALPVDKKTALAAALLGGRPSEILSRLVALLAQRERFELLPLIAEAYGRLWARARGIVEAEAVSAGELDEAEARAVSAAVRQASGGREVELRRRVEPGLLGGMLLRMDGRVYDGSVRARLRALRETLAGGQRT